MPAKEDDCSTMCSMILNLSYLVLHTSEVGLIIVMLWVVTSTFRLITVRKIKDNRFCLRSLTNIAIYSSLHNEVFCLIECVEGYSSLTLNA